MYGHRFNRLGMPGIIGDAKQPVRKKTISNELIKEILQSTLSSKISAGVDLLRNSSTEVGIMAGIGFRHF
jgi:hypothetical protein